MIAVDSSIAVAAFAPWHERHEQARHVMSDGPRIVAHAALETYAVLTRLPPPFRAPAEAAASFLARRFPDPPLALDEEAQGTLVSRLLDRGIEGSAVYDAIIALTAAASGARLASLDARALETYRRCEVEVDLIR